RSLSGAGGLDGNPDPGYDRRMRKATIRSTSQVLEGTWEEIARQGERLAGRRVRLEVLESGQEATEASELPFYATATAAERARAWEEWCRLPRPRVPPLSDQAISRESIYSPD